MTSRILKFMAVCLGLAVPFCSSAKDAKTVYLSEFLSEGMAQTDAEPAVRAALSKVKETNAERLVLPGGKLCIKPDKAYEQYQFISNNNESLKRIAFQLDGFKNLTIDGQGTELVFSGFVSPFNLENCSDITIENLSIDFTRPFHSEGTITNSFDGGIDIAFAEEYGAEINNGVLRFRDKDGKVYAYGSMLEFDVNKREPAYYAQDIWLWSGTPVTKNDDGSFRFTGKNMVGTPGNIMIFGALARYNPAFTLYGCSDATIKNVTVYHCGGMGVIAQCSRDVELNHFDVVPPAGRMVSATADATHFVNCTGYIRMKDCTFKNQKDDATNIHGLYMAVDTVTAPDKALLRWHNSGQFGVDFIRPGMTLEIVDNDNMNAYARRKVKSVERFNKIYTEVTFAENLPDGIKKGHVMAADDEYPEVLITRCHFSGNRARGLLLGSRAKTIVQDCYFHVPGAAILFEGDGNYWWEQSGVRDVVIRRNVFENGNYGSPSWGSACIAVGSGIPKPESCRYHKNITVKGNTFRVFDPRIINIYCVDGFTFTPDNKIEMTDAYRYGREETRNFVSTDCDNVKFSR